MASITLGVVVCACAASAPGPSAEGPAGPTGPEPTGELTAATSTITRDPLPAPSGDRFEIAVEPTSFEASDGLLLVGHLYFPRGPLPKGAVLLLHDAGPHDRSGTVEGQLGLDFGFELPVLEGLARALAERGYVVLSYDKRSCGKFNGCGDNAYPEPADALDLQTLLLDGLSAADALVDHLMTDPERTVVLGLGQGATLVPHVLQSRSGLAGGVLVGAPHDPIDELFLAQAKQVSVILSAKGLPASAANPHRELAVRVRALRAEAVDHRVAGHPASYWRSWLNLSDSAPAIARSLARPILVVGGSLDWTVPASQRQRWARTLAPSRKARVITVPNVTHALNRVSTKSITDIRAADVGRAIDPELVDVIEGFLVETLKDRGR